MAYNPHLKRIFDLLLAFLLLPFVSLLLILLTPLIYFEDRGPVFYVSKRLGRNGKVFQMYKLRTMSVNAPDLRNNDGSTFNSKIDHRVTKIGYFLRSSSIDETPQLFNVLLGHMSLVGPRPDLPEHLNMYDVRDKIKLNVKPGITGYNQAFFRNSIPWKQRLENDIYYVDNISIKFDLKIIIATFSTIIKRKNVYIN